MNLRDEAKAVELAFSRLWLLEKDVYWVLLSPFDFIVPQRLTELDAFTRNRIIVSCDRRLFGIPILFSK